jgi:hypothetical protein
MQHMKLGRSETGLKSFGIPFGPWNEISHPGIYVDTRCPRYFRVPAEGLHAKSRPLIQASEFTVARISSNPMLSKGRIQSLCANYGLPVPD